MCLEAKENTLRSAHLPNECIPCPGALAPRTVCSWQRTPRHIWTQREVRPRPCAPGLRMLEIVHAPGYLRAQAQTHPGTRRSPAAPHAQMRCAALIVQLIVTIAECTARTLDTPQVPRAHRPSSPRAQCIRPGVHAGLTTCMPWCEHWAHRTCPGTHCTDCAAYSNDPVDLLQPLTIRSPITKRFVKMVMFRMTIEKGISKQRQTD